jgi:hypothetical protein
MKTRNVCRWLDDDPVTGNPVLRICTGKLVLEYEVETLPRCIKLWRIDPETFYLVCRTITTYPNYGSWSCDCEDAQRRDRFNCKHVRAVKAALNAKPF